MCRIFRKNPTKSFGNSLHSFPYISHHKFYLTGVIPIRTLTSFHKTAALVLCAAALCGCSNNPTEEQSLSGGASLAYDYITETEPAALPTPTEEPRTTEPQTAESAEEASEEAVRDPREVHIGSFDENEFHAEIDRIAAENGVNGFTLCVFANGEIIHTYSDGMADRAAGIPCGENTKYRMSSISKLAATMALMTLYDEGVLTPESELEQLTGMPYNNPQFPDTPVKLWHLLTHTAGLTDNYAYDQSASRKYTTDYILSTAYNGREPGTFYTYSNFGMGTVGSVTERLTGEFFHDFADRVLFDPLGMDAGYTISKIDDKQSVAVLYAPDGTQNDPRAWGRTARYYESFGLGNSYLTANSELLISCPDLARLGIILAGDGSCGGIRVLSREAVDLINAEYFSEKKFDLGLSVRIYRDNLIEGRVIHGHPGQALGTVNGIYYDVHDGTGMAFCSNGSLAYTSYENGVYDILNDTVRTVYSTFFSGETEA